METLKKIIKTQGILGPFKGNSASIARIFPFSAIEFYAFEYFKNKIIRGQKARQNSLYYTSICGALTGLSAITITFPLDVARTRLAVITSSGQNLNKGLFTSVKELFNEYGVRGLYKGYSSAFIVYFFIIFKGSIPYVAIKQTSFDLMKNNFMIDSYRNSLNFTYGCLSGLVGTVLLYPSYLIKRILQANGIIYFWLLR